jgi:hypothetical protein
MACPEVVRRPFATRVLGRLRHGHDDPSDWTAAAATSVSACVNLLAGAQEGPNGVSERLRAMVDGCAHVLGAIHSVGCVGCVCVLALDEG